MPKSRLTQGYVWARYHESLTWHAARKEGEFGFLRAACGRVFSRHDDLRERPATLRRVCRECKGHWPAGLCPLCCRELETYHAEDGTCGYLPCPCIGGDG